MPKVRNLFWQIPLIIVLTFPFWQSFVVDFLDPADEVVTAADTRRQAGSFSMEKVIFSQFKKGTKEWHINAEYLYSENNEDDLEMEKISARFLGSPPNKEDTKPSTHITGNKARYKKNKQILTISEDVKVVTDDGYKVETEVLLFQEKAGKLKASSGVHITGDKVAVQGRELTYDLNTRNFEIQGRVAAELK